MNSKFESCIKELSEETLKIAILKYGNEHPEFVTCFLEVLENTPKCTFQEEIKVKAESLFYRLEKIDDPYERASQYVQETQNCIHQIQHFKENQYEDQAIFVINWLLIYSKREPIFINLTKPNCKTVNRQLITILTESIKHINLDSILMKYVDVLIKLYSSEKE